MNLFGLGPPELLLIAFLFLLFFGKDRLPEIARGVGQAFNELKGGFSEGLTKEEKSDETQPKDS